jgi:hypothetical protein
MDTTIQDAINNYYKLKQKYDSSIQKKKQKIIMNDSLTTNMKRQKIKEIKKLCVNCGKKGGSIFRNVDDTLLATCGSLEKCNLNINIKKGNYSNIRTECYNLQETINEIQTNIISTKLKILFNYISEDDAIKEFKKLKRTLAGILKLYDEMRKAYLSIVTRGYNSPELKDKHGVLLIAVTQLREFSNQYDIAEKAGEPKDKLLSDMVEKYINDIIPIVTEIRSLAYINSRIEHVTITENNSTIDVDKLIQEPYTINELYSTGQLPQIINNRTA